jgi:integrase
MRNKVVLGLLIYQGIHTYELQKLTVNDIDLNSGTVRIPQCSRSNPRTLKLEPFQINDLREYIKKFRPTILAFTKIQTDRLIFSIGGSESNGNMLSKMKKAIRKIEPSFTTMAKIRASVIANWTRKYDPIRVMNMAGHRYVSSTEYYMVGDNETLRDELDKIHPLENIIQ